MIEGGVTVFKENLKYILVTGFIGYFCFLLGTAIGYQRHDDQSYRQALAFHHHQSSSLTTKSHAKEQAKEQAKQHPEKYTKKHTKKHIKKHPDFSDVGKSAVERTP